MCQITIVSGDICSLAHSFVSTFDWEKFSSFTFRSCIAYSRNKVFADTRIAISIKE
nr:MAG TPA: hypothetical protein [Caudoviricetes sp.]